LNLVHTIILQLVTTTLTTRIGIYIVKFAAVELGNCQQAEWVETVVLAEPLR
jgi:hypothetical protein